MQRAVEWSKLGSFRLLRFLTPFAAACAALLDERRVEAADLVDEFWALAITVPVWQVFAVPVVVVASRGGGRAPATRLPLLVRTRAPSPRPGTCARAEVPRRDAPSVCRRERPGQGILASNIRSVEPGTNSPALPASDSISS